MAQVNGIAVWTEGIKAELAKRLPKQRKTQRDKLGNAWGCSAANCRVIYALFGD
jgi:hypothetical protein